jgi:hypothetical protein
MHSIAEDTLRRLTARRPVGLAAVMHDVAAAVMWRAA